MIDLTSGGVNFAVLQGQLLAGDIDRSVFLEHASRLGIGASEVAALMSPRAMDDFILRVADAFGVERKAWPAIRFLILN